MKLRYLASVVVLALTTVAAHAQVGLYFNPLAIRVSNSVADYGPFAFLGQYSTSNVFYGFDIGGYYDFFHQGKLSVGGDIRESDLHAANASLRSFQVGVRLSATPFKRPFKPYVEVQLGDGNTKPQASAVRLGKIDYGFLGGVDYPIARHVDFRIFELGYTSLVTVSTATVGEGGNFAMPASNLVTFSSGLVFRF